MKRILLIASIILILPLSANAQRRSRESLESENAQLRSRITGMQEDIVRLEQEVKSLKAQLRALENIPDEIVEYYAVEDPVVEAMTEAGTPSPENRDSLLSVWYLHNQMRSNPEADGLSLDEIHFTTSVSDSVLIDRLSRMNSFMKLPYNETVRNWMVLYSEKMPNRMSQMLGLSKFYMPIFEETFRKYDLPLELKYLCIIESAMNPVAVSRAGAAGMWQFMYSTARHYGLQVDSYVDERLDPFKEVDAAARLLKDNYSIFGDWSLAISAYNCGPGNVNKAIHRAGGNTDFWTIYEYLPKETRGYVPAMVGAMYAFHYAKEYGLEPAPMQLPAHVDTFHINKNLHFRQISEVIDIPLDEIRSLNHQYYRDIIPGNQGTMILRLPYTYSAAFAAKQQAIYAHKANEYLSGHGDIDRQTGYTASTGAPSGNNRSGNSGRSSSTRPASTQWVYYTVKSGDNLGKIAKRYGTTVSNIKKWNNLRSDVIHPGDKLKVGKR